MNLLPRTRAVATEEDQTDSDSDSDDSSVDNGSTRSRRGRKRTRRYVDSSDEEEEAQETTTFDFPTHWIRRVNEGKADLFKMGLSSNMEEATMRGIVGKHEHSNPNALTLPRLRVKLQEWAELPSSLHRKYFWYSLPKIKDRIREIDSQTRILGNKVALMDLLVELENRQTVRNNLIDQGEDPYRDGVDPVLLELFRSSYMKPLSD